MSHPHKTVRAFDTGCKCTPKPSTGTGFPSMPQSPSFERSMNTVPNFDGWIRMISGSPRIRYCRHTHVSASLRGTQQDSSQQQVCRIQHVSRVHHLGSHKSRVASYCCQFIIGVITQDVWSNIACTIRVTGVRPFPADMQRTWIICTYKHGNPSAFPTTGTSTCNSCISLKPALLKAKCSGKALGRALLISAFVSKSVQAAAYRLAIRCSNLHLAWDVLMSHCSHLDQ